MGRPCSYTDEIADEICERIANGESLVSICKSEHIPHRTTVLRWMETDDAFATRCARAREAHADFAHDRMIDIENNVLQGGVDPAAARVALSSMQWRAAKLAPKKYSDKVVNEHTGADGGPIQTEATVIDAASMTSEERSTMRAILVAAQARKEGDK